jgi:gluconate 2-dehydrogenase subunit 3-like protein
MRFTPQEEAALRAAVDRILPADDVAGAWEAGAGVYLERQLDGPLADRRDDVRRGLQGLDAEAAARGGAAFAALAAGEQDGILRDLEAGTVRTEWSVPPALFFDLLVRTTAEGFYADPAQGGNRGRVSWTMTGFEPEEA